MINSVIGPRVKSAFTPLVSAESMTGGRDDACLWLILLPQPMGQVEAAASPALDCRCRWTGAQNAPLRRPLASADRAILRARVGLLLVHS